MMLKTVEPWQHRTCASFLVLQLSCSAQSRLFRVWVPGEACWICSAALYRTLPQLSVVVCALVPCHGLIPIESESHELLHWWWQTILPHSSPYFILKGCMMHVIVSNVGPVVAVRMHLAHFIVNGNYSRQGRWSGPYKIEEYSNIRVWEADRLTNYLWPRIEWWVTSHR